MCFSPCLGVGGGGGLPRGLGCSVHGARCTVHGAVCTVHGAGCRVQCARCRVQGAVCTVQGAWCTVQGAGCSVQGAGCRVQCAGCRVQGAGCSVRAEDDMRSSEGSVCKVHTAQHPGCEVKVQCVQCAMRSQGVHSAQSPVCRGQRLQSAECVVRSTKCSVRGVVCNAVCSTWLNLGFDEGAHSTAVWERLAEAGRTDISMASVGCFLAPTLDSHLGWQRTSTRAFDGLGLVATMLICTGASRSWKWRARPIRTHGCPQPPPPLKCPPPPPVQALEP